MNGPANLNEKLLRRRKTMVTGMIVLTALVLLGFAFGSWRYVQEIGNYLEEELGRRLLSVATLTVDLIESVDFPIDYVLHSGKLDLTLNAVNEILEEVHRENQLQGIYLVDQTYHLISGSPDLFTFGERLSFLEEDSITFNQAVAGISEVAELKVVEGNRFKSAYAPVIGPFGDVAAVIVVQASADFFDLLRIFQRGLILGGIVSVALAILFSVFLFWAISLLMKTQESLQKTERLAAMGQMAATVAHEIRNPLGIIKGTADVLRSKYGSKEEPDELFDFIPAEVMRLNRLVSDFLAFSRDRDLERNATDLKSTVEKTMSNLADEMNQANVNLEKDYDDVPEVDHDEDAINQVLLNFALNSIQSMNGGGNITVRLKNESRKNRGFVRIEVEDTGSGFDAEPEKIFEPFFTTKTSGSGLGLAICKRLIEKHNGWIEAESQKGVGTKMRFYLPV